MIDLLNGISNARGMEQVLIDIGAEEPVGRAISSIKYAGSREIGGKNEQK